MTIVGACKFLYRAGPHALSMWAFSPTSVQFALKKMGILHTEKNMAMKSRPARLADAHAPSTPITYLLQLMQVRLPAKFVDPHELRLISVLKATELIEAEVHTARGSGLRYWEARAATVTRITEDGLAELAKMSLDLLRSAKRAVGKPMGPLEYLCLIETSPFPIRVEGRTAVSNVTLLRAAGLVEATIAAPPRGGPDDAHQALVLRITPRGHEELVRQK